MDDISKLNFKISQSAISKFKKEVEQELFSILDYWMNYAIDKVNGGFSGKIDNENNVDASAPKGAVLNARILWSFSAAFNQYKNKKNFNVATTAFDSIAEYFFDMEFVAWF